MGKKGKGWKTEYNDWPEERVADLLPGDVIAPFELEVSEVRHREYVEVIYTNGRSAVLRKDVMVRVKKVNAEMS